MDEKKPGRSSLCLTLRKGETVDVGDVTVVCKGRKPGTNSVVICFVAPRTTPIKRHKAKPEAKPEAEVEVET